MKTKNNDALTMDESEFQIMPASHEDLAETQSFLTPFMDGQLLLQRTSLELELLLKHSFKALHGGQIVGCCALEVYSKKLAEIQCLAVAAEFRRKGVGVKLVPRCIDRARDEKIQE